MQINSQFGGLCAVVVLMTANRSCEKLHPCSLKEKVQKFKTGENDHPVCLPLVRQWNHVVYPDRAGRLGLRDPRDVTALGKPIVLDDELRFRIHELVGGADRAIADLDSLANLLWCFALAHEI